MPRVLASSRVPCLDEDLITDLAGAGPTGYTGVEDHLANVVLCNLAGIGGGGLRRRFGAEA